MKKNEKSLGRVFQLPILATRSGRPTKPFGDVSAKSKRSKNENIRLPDGIRNIIYADLIELRTQGNRSTLDILEEISENRDHARKVVEYNKKIKQAIPMEYDKIKESKLNFLLFSFTGI